MCFKMALWLICSFINEIIFVHYDYLIYPYLGLSVLDLYVFLGYHFFNSKSYSAEFYYVAFLHFKAILKLLNLVTAILDLVRLRYPFTILI